MCSGFLIYLHFPEDIDVEDPFIGLFVISESSLVRCLSGLRPIFKSGCLLIVVFLEFSYIKDNSPLSDVSFSFSPNNC